MMYHGLRKAYWFVSQQMGLDPVRLLRMPVGLLRYARDLWAYSRTNTLSLRPLPCLHDWWEQAGAVRSEYFWQDLFVARLVHAAAPKVHVDIGSRLDGFVAHVASFRTIEVYDVRPLTTEIPGVTFRQADLMSSESLPAGVTDSLSCLHAIEHFGLGRYGDPLNPEGVSLGLKSMAKLLAPGGRLYLSCPVGPDVVYFNAHRALHPASVQGLAEKAGLVLDTCWLFDSTGMRWIDAPARLSDYQPAGTHTLAVYTFDKPR